MSRGYRVEDDAFNTINAAATAIASVDVRGDRVSVQKRWGSCFSIFWCFGWSKNKRIGSAIIVPDTIFTSTNSTAAQNVSQPTPIVLPFIAPPSSPVSFLVSETPSVVQSPTTILSPVTISAGNGMYSPSCPPSIFAIGPYAHETQLVSPPVFSSFPTEPSTAPYTPAESVHLTTPSSPEVPFARLLQSSLPSDENCPRYQFSQYEFQYYHLQPGSPLSHLISPCSGISYSGTSSPFRNSESSKVDPSFLKDSLCGYPDRLLDLEKIVIQQWGSHPGSNIGTPRANMNCENPDASSPALTQNAPETDRVSSDLVLKNIEEADEEKAEVISEDKSKCHDFKSPSLKDIMIYERKRTITLGSSKEFNFDGMDVVNSDEPLIDSSILWKNEVVVAEDGTPSKKWPFFPSLS